MVTSTPASAHAAPTLTRERGRTAGRPPAAPKKINPLQVAVMVGIVLLCVSALWRVTHSSTVNPNMIKVVTFNRDVPAGVRISFMMLRFMDVPKPYVTPDMVRNLNTVIDHETRTFVPANEPISSGMFFPEARGMSRNLRADERAITLQLGDDALVDHSIRPDDRVDVLVVSTADGKKYTKTICQAARVLMAATKEQTLDKRLARMVDKITLAVAPSVTETLTEAADSGKLRLILRNPNMQVQEDLAGSGPDDLLPESARRARAQDNGNSPVSTSVPSPPTPADAKQQAAMSPDPSAMAMPMPPPLDWLVQIISGNHKETVSVPRR